MENVAEVQKWKMEEVKWKMDEAVTLNLFQDLFSGGDAEMTVVNSTLF